MENCRPAIIASFGVTAHCGPLQGDGAAGIDSLAEFRGICFSRDSKHLAWSPSKGGGRAVAIFVL